MITNVDIVLKCNKNVTLGQEFIENFDGNVRNITLESYSGETISLDCDESYITGLTNTDKDLSTIFVKDGIVDVFELIEEIEPSKIDMVLLIGYKYRVISDGCNLMLYNEINRTIDYSSNVNDLISLLSSIDPNFTTYVNKFDFL